MINELSNESFQKKVWAHYDKSGRHDLPWRIPEPDGSFDAYVIMVSEVMLQQTQVSRVIPKYREFIEKYPTVTTLAEAPLGDVLRTWSGLGYNRRAKFLREAAKQIVANHQARVPMNVEELVQLPGIGINTAGAIVAYAFNQPVAFVETNIRAVFIHHFFKKQTAVSDKAVLQLVQKTLDNNRPRQWYWALMDYGSKLKGAVPNPNHSSKQYAKQSKFEGSWRQLRGQVLRMLGDHPYSSDVLQETIRDERLPNVLSELVNEKMIRRRGASYHL
jgi:A/G-specific adenine glycosylase